ncbi:ParA family protein [Parachitinimonas caeni]|uniref:ParA family protein n=1 Tax=Parachitinimonas caeni TaxID=3031301 RepID=A0ABT7E1R7_9NEIS|nr:ParA family protein [Parachitinimonas caeni]MDK2126253.1 ParA family protein [Parachitinimonas caeni]
MTIIIAIATQKGGVGKTSSAVNLADAFVRRGKRTLLIDLDPQSNATSIISEVNPGKLRFNTVNLLLDSDPTVASACIIGSRIKGLDMIASSIKLARAAETELIRRNTTTLRKRLAIIAADYDIIILDSPPNLGRLTSNALCAATHYLVPIKGADIFSLDGYEDLEATVKEAKEDNPQLQLLGAFLNMYDGRTNVAQQLLGVAESKFGKDLLSARLPRSVQFEEAAATSKTVLEAARDGSPAKAVTELADEILVRVGLT